MIVTSCKMCGKHLDKIKDYCEECEEIHKTIPLIDFRLIYLGICEKCASSGYTSCGCSQNKSPIKDDLVAIHYWEHCGFDGAYKANQIDINIFKARHFLKIREYGI